MKIFQLYTLCSTTSFSQISKATTNQERMPSTYIFRLYILLYIPLQPCCHVAAMSLPSCSPSLSHPVHRAMLPTSRDGSTHHLPILVSSRQLESHNFKFDRCFHCINRETLIFLAVHWKRSPRSSYIDQVSQRGLRR